MASGEVWIGAPGWASTNVEQVRAKSYGYDQTMDQTQSDETLAYAALDTAIDAGKPWVGFCYTPHYVFALHELQVLEEPPIMIASKWDVKQPTDDPNWLENSDRGQRLGQRLSAHPLPEGTGREPSRCGGSSVANAAAGRPKRSAT